MKVDPNVYALSIQLAFEATEAFTTLDDFSQKVTDLEESVSSAAQKAISGITSIADIANSALIDIGKNLVQIDTNAVKITTNLNDATKELQDQFDTGKDRLKDIKEEDEYREKHQKMSEELTEELTKHLSFGAKFLTITSDIIKAVLKKNRGHAEQNDLLQNDVDTVIDLNSNLTDTTQKTDDINKSLGKSGIAWREIWGWIKKADEDTEKFTTTNFRHYGSQQQLLEGARSLAMANGVMSEKAIEAYAVMGNLKVPREELDKYATAVAMASRTTGAGVETTGEYVNRLRTAGMNLAGTERQLTHMGEAMRKYGLNTRDVNALMSESVVNAKNAKFAFGEVGLEEWEKSRQIMAGFARQTGHSADEMAGFETWILNDVVALEQFKAITNTTEKGIDGYRLAMLRAGIQAEKQYQALEAQRDAGKISYAEMNALQQSTIDIQFGGNRAAYDAARAQGALAMQYNLTGKSIEEVNQISEVFANTLKEQNAEANYTFTAQLRQLTDKLTTAGLMVMSFVADALLPLIYALNQVVMAIAWTIGKIAEFIKWLEQIPVIGKVVIYLKYAVGIVIALGIAAFFLISALVTFLGIFAGFGNLLGRMTASVQALADMLLIAAKAIGESIEIILTGLGKGLQALGNSVKSVMVPLLALGLALMLAGIGAYFLALGVKTLAEVGWAAVPAMIGLIASVALLGLVLVGLATLVQGPVAVGLVILAVAILAVGAAAYLMGLGLMMAGQGIVLIASVISMSLVASMAAMAGAVLLLGVAGVLASPGLIVLGFALFAIGAGAMMAATALQMIGVAIETISVSKLTDLGLELLNASIILLPAAVAIAIAGVALHFGAMALLVGAVMLSFAAGVLIIASSLFMAGAVITMVGAAALVIASVLIVGSSLLIAVGAIGLLIGSAALLVASVVLHVAAIGLFFAGVMLAIGAGAMLPAAIMTFVAGVAIGIGGVAMLYGAQSLLQAMPLLLQIAPSMLYAGVAIAAGSVGLLAASALIFPAGVGIMLGGLMIMLGAHMLVGGMRLIAGVAPIMAAASSALIAGTAAMASSMVLLAAIAPLIVLTGAAVLIGGTFLIVGMSFLMAGALMAFTAGTMIGVGGQMMLAGMQGILQASALMSEIGFGFFKGALRLTAAVLVLVPVAALMVAVGSMIAVGGLAMLVGSVNLLMAGIVIQEASGLLLPAAQMLQLAMRLLLPAAVGAYTASVYLVAAGVQLLSGAIALVLAAPALAIGALALAYGATVLTTAGLILVVGSMLVLIGANTLYAATGYLAAINPALAGGSQSLLESSAILESASYSLLAAGAALVPASAMIYFGMFGLVSAISRFSKSISDIERVSKSVLMLATAFAILHSTPIGALKETATTALGALPSITALGDGLAVASIKLDNGVKLFAGPAERLNAILMNLSETITAFGMGLNLADDVGRLAEMLENYAGLLENASERIETAVQTKAIPAMRAAEQAGINETIRSEAISTVQVLTHTDGESRDAQVESTQLLVSLNDTMKSIDNRLAEMSPGGRGELAEIVSLLQAYLPNSVKGDSGLGSEFNNWSK